MSTTKIDWPGLSHVYNPIIGCSCGCSKATTGYDCYAKKFNTRFKWIPDFSQPTFFPNKLNIPFKVKQPSTFFVCSTADIMDGRVNTDWVNKIIEVMSGTPQHTYMLLSKQPFRYKRWTFPENVWLGATVESSEHSDRIWDLISDNPENKKFLSIEPLLGSFAGTELIRNVALVIVGADSTAGAKVPPLEWVRSIHHPNIWYKNNLRKHYPELINSSVT